MIKGNFVKIVQVLRRAVRIRTDVSEKHIAFINRVATIRY
jgi:hypothetical protein